MFKMIIYLKQLVLVLSSPGFSAVYEDVKKKEDAPQYPLKKNDAAHTVEVLTQNNILRNHLLVILRQALSKH